MVGDSHSREEAEVMCLCSIMQAYGMETRLQLRCYFMFVLLVDFYQRDYSSYLCVNKILMQFMIFFLPSMGCANTSTLIFRRKNTHNTKCKATTRMVAVSTTSKTTRPMTKTTTLKSTTTTKHRKRQQQQQHM